MQQSKKLQEENERALEGFTAQRLPDLPEQRAEGVLKIRPIPTYNDWIIIIQETIDTGDIVVPDGSKEFNKSEGVVIGVPAPGNGLPDNSGSRLPSQVKVGDKVLFQENAYKELKSGPGTFYAGKKIIVVSERNLICRLRPIPFDLVQEED